VSTSTSTSHESRWSGDSDDESRLANDARSKSMKSPVRQPRRDDDDALTRRRARRHVVARRR